MITNSIRRCHLCPIRNVCIISKRQDSSPPKTVCCRQECLWPGFRFVSCAPCLFSVSGEAVDEYYAAFDLLVSLVRSIGVVVICKDVLDCSFWTAVELFNTFWEYLS